MELIDIGISLNSDLRTNTSEDDVFDRTGALDKGSSLFEGVFESVQVEVVVDEPSVDGWLLEGRSSVERDGAAYIR